MAKYDIYAEFCDTIFGINFNRLKNEISSLITRAKLLKLASNQTKAKEKHKEWLESIDFSEELKLIENLNIISNLNLNYLPLYSFFIKITFTLKKPYLSRDDEEFYILDNPVCKDKVFKVPYVRPSSWKGALRWVAKNVLKKDPRVIERLLGNVKENEIARQGRLTLYPTFFNKIGLDIIAPHDRKTKTVKVPIQFEVVPEGAKGTFALLYAPFDLVEKDDNNIKKEVKEDLEIIKDSVKALLCEYGFSAKRTSGYGVIEDYFENGRLKTNFAGDLEFRNWKVFISVINNVVEVLKNE